MSESPAVNLPARWIGDLGFGNYLRQLRKNAGLVGRDAAPFFGFGQAYLSKLENHTCKRPPKMAFLRQVAAVYGCDLADVMHAAGFRFHLSESATADLRIASTFAAVMSDPRVGPKDFERRDLHFYSPSMQRQVVELLRNASTLLSEDGIDVLAGLDTTEGA